MAAKRAEGESSITNHSASCTAGTGAILGFVEEVCVGRTCFVYSGGEGGENIFNLIVSWERFVFDYDWKIEVTIRKKCEGPDSLGI